MEETITNIVIILVTLIVVFYAGTIWKRNKVQDDAQSELDISIENDEKRAELIEQAKEQLEINEEVLERVIEMDKELIEQSKNQIIRAEEVLKRAKEALYNNSNIFHDH